MKIWMLIAIIMLGILVIAGTAIAINQPADSESEKETQQTQTCPYANSCSQSSNCGRATCGAIQGKSCGCGK
jgi:hypothetical protein